MSMPDIDPDAYYSLDEVVEFLRQADPSLTLEEARKEIITAIALGLLPTVQARPH